MLRRAVECLHNLDHRGALSADGTGDGAGIMRGHADLTTAPPRHLLDRGSCPTHLRLEDLQTTGQGVGEAGVGPRRGDHRRRGCQGAGRRRDDLGQLRRDRRIAAGQHQARRFAVGGRARRGPSGAGRQRPAEHDHRGDRWWPADRHRRRCGRAPRGQPVRLRNASPSRPRVQDGSPMPSQYVPGRDCHPARRSAGEVTRAPSTRSSCSSV